MEAEPRPEAKPKGKVRLLTLDDLDKRTTAARQALEERDRIIAERGGADGMGVVRLALADSVALLNAMIRHEQAQWLRGEPIDPDTLAKLINTRGREAERVGLNIDPRDVTPANDHLRRVVEGRA